MCIIPKKYRKYEHLLDLDKDNVVTDEEIKKATEILEKAKRKKEYQLKVMKKQMRLPRN